MIKIAIVVCCAALAAAEAEADPAFFYQTYGYGAGLYNNAYTTGYTGYNMPQYRSYAAHAAPLASYPASAAYAVRGYGAPATVGSYTPYGYAASGHYVADSVGAVHVAKREAEAEPEADADALYGNYGYGLGYSAYSRPVYGGYSTYSRPIISSYAARPVVSSIGYSAYSRPVYGGYSSYYGKRDAEAEPEADAQYLGYSGLYGGYSTYARPIVSSVYSRPIISSVYSRGIYGHY